ncbi:MAG: AAA family ATPase [Candidatus Heimdallarchaeaceae archaeon]
MIKSLKLKDFRGIKKGKLNFAPITILLGPNNSGKTAILEALFLAPNPFRRVPYMLSKSYETRAIDVVLSLHETLDSKSLITLFHNYVSDTIELELNCSYDEKYTLRFITDNKHVFVSTSKELKDAQTKIIKGMKVHWFGVISKSPHQYGPIYFQDALIENTLLISTNLMKSAFWYLKSNWAPIVNTGICKKVAKEFSSFTYEKYTNITIEPFINDTYSINALLEDGRRIRLGDLGAGAQIYIIARILSEFEEPEVLLWDDVESHFNPRILLKIADWFADLIEKNKQVIISTHSLEATKIIAGLNEEVTSILLTLLDDDNNLKVKELKLKDVEDLLESGIDVRVAESLIL